MKLVITLIEHVIESKHWWEFLCTCIRTKKKNRRALIVMKSVIPRVQDLQKTEL